MAVAISAAAQAVGRLPPPLAVLVGVVALAVVLVPGFWALVRHIHVMAHEGAHAMVGSVLDTRVTAVRVKSNGTGETFIHAVPGSGFVYQVAGYLGPSGFGLAAAALIAHGLIVAVLWIGVVLLAILLPSLRNAFGIAMVVGTGFLLFSITRSGNAGLEAVTAYWLSWMLLLSGVSMVVQHGAGAGDAGNLRRITGLPRGLWSFLWLVGTVLALIYGCTLLV